MIPKELGDPGEVRQIWLGQKLNHRACLHIALSLLYGPYSIWIPAASEHCRTLLGPAVLRPLQSWEGAEQQELGGGRGANRSTSQLLKYGSGSPGLKDLQGQPQ